MKDYLRLEGFVDIDESTTESISYFTYDDTLITNMIIAARRKAENYCGISIVFHSWEVLLKNEAGDFELPYGPVQNVTGVTDADENVLDSDSYKFRGLDFKYLVSPLQDNITVEYDAGYEDCPEGIRLAIKQMVAYWYDKRAAGSIPELALTTLANFKRPWTWLA
jgi:uncharacterized phiE125 gp8 family phage protein